MPVLPTSAAPPAQTIPDLPETDLPPRSLPAEMIAAWREIVADLKSRKLWHQTVAGAVESYLIARWAARRAQKAIEEHGELVKTSDGLLKANPALGLLRTSQDTAARLAAELGLTPSARSRKALRVSEQQRDMFGEEWDL